ncbi:MAG: AMP-binding protein [Acidobacteriia bacterium]|nr:AMP-binding protein [Terriglobia bacterium]
MPEHENNFFDRFAATAQHYGGNVAVELQHRDSVETATYAELREQAEAAAGFLAARGIRTGDACAILADNDIAWCAVYLGALRVGALAVPLDTHYSPEQIATLLRDSGAKMLFTTPRFVADVEEARRLSGSAAEIVLLRGRHQDLPSFDELQKKEWPALPAGSVTREDPAVILYTSGTTSDPKGVVLTHGNLLAEADAVFSTLQIGAQDSVLGVMPLYHALAQMANLLLPFVTGARVIYLEEISSSELLKALRQHRPTAFCCVPQFFYLIHQRVFARVAESAWTRRALFRLLLRANAASRRLLGLNLGPLFFSAVHDVIGREMRFLVTGGARFDPLVGRDFYRLGFNLLEAYGLTESSGAATLTRPGEGGLGFVGRPLPGVEVKILPAGAGAENGDTRGEIAIRGPIVMQGYFRRPDATAAVVQDGWFLTGDLGCLDAQGRLAITGRKKEVIILSSGKNIYPEEIEAHYLQSPYIAELCVLGLAAPGEPAAERLHAVVVPNLEVLRERKIVNIKEALRFDIENLSVHLPAHKRILSYAIRMEPLPRTTTRKLKRYEIERQVRSRAPEAEKPAASAKPAAEPDAAWAADPDLTRALELVREAAHDKSAVHPDANLELDLGLDSIERIELLTNLEQLFASAMPAAAAESAYTVRQLVEAVRAQAGAPAAARRVHAWSKLLADLPEEEPLLRDLLQPHHILTFACFVVLKLARLAARFLLGFHVSGLEHLPKDGAFLLCPNHQSYLDAFLLVSALPWRIFRRLFFVGASEYFATPLRARAARALHVAPVDPDAHLLQALQAGAFGLRHGRILVLFPEGERSIDGEIKKFRKGVAILAAHAQVPVVPAALEGLFAVWPRDRALCWRTFLPWKQTRVTLRFGPAIPPAPAPGAEATQAQSEARYSAFAERLRGIVVDLQSSLRAKSASS